MKELISLMLSAILAENLALTAFLGAESLGIGADKSPRDNLSNGVGVLIALVVSALVNNVLGGVLESIGMGYLSILCFTSVAMGVSYVLAFLLKQSSLQLLALNTILLGGCLAFAGKGLTLLETLFAAVGTGVGYTLVALALSGIRERMNDKHIPTPFRGLPITAAALSIVALAIYAF